MKEGKEHGRERCREARMSKKRGNGIREEARVDSRNDMYGGMWECRWEEGRNREGGRE